MRFLRRRSAGSAPELVGRQVHGPLEQVAGLGTAGAAVRVHRDGVGEDPVHLAEDGGDVVDAVEQRPVEVGGDRGREERQVRAEVGHGLDPEPGQLAARVEPHLHLGDVVASLGIGEEALGALGGPLHRHPELLRQPGHGDLLGVDEDLRPEAAADVRGDDPEPLLGQAEDERAHDQPVHVRVLRGDPEGQLVGGGLVAGERGPGSMALAISRWLTSRVRTTFAAPRERGLGPRPVADLPVEAAVVGRAGVDLGRARPEGGDRVHHHRERLVVHLDQLRGVAGDRRRLGHHHRHRLAGVAHQVHGNGPEVGGLQAREEPPHRDGVDPCVGEVLPGEHRPHSGVGQRPRAVDAADAGVRQGAADEHRVLRPRELHVVGVRASSGDEPGVLSPPDGLAHQTLDARRRHAQPPIGPGPGPARRRTAPRPASSPPTAPP